MSCSIFRPLIIFIIIFFAAWPTLGQRGRETTTAFRQIQVTGQVRYARGGTPADKVLVRLESFGGGIIGEIMTDRTGKFRFSGLQPDQYIVTVRLFGFKEVQQHVNLRDATSEYLLFQLVADSSAPSTAPTSSSVVVNASTPADAQKEFEEGRAALLDRKEVEKSLPHLEKAVSIYPNFLDAQFLLGTAYMDLHQWDKAERALRRTLEINPNSSAALFALGEVYLRQKKYVEAEKSLQEGLKLDKDSWQGHFALGRTYWSMGNISKAGPQVGRALQLKPDLAEAHLLAGNILLRARQPENALTEFEEYVRLAPKGEFAEQARATAQKIRHALAEKKK